MPEATFTGRSVLTTGATGRIGQAVATEFGRARTAGSARSREGLVWSRYLPWISSTSPGGGAGVYDGSRLDAGLVSGPHQILVIHARRPGRLAQGWMSIR